MPSSNSSTSLAKALPKALRKLRFELGKERQLKRLTLEQMGEEFGVTWQTISEWERANELTKFQVKKIVNIATRKGWLQKLGVEPIRVTAERAVAGVALVREQMETYAALPDVEGADTPEELYWAFITASRALEVIKMPMTHEIARDWLTKLHYRHLGEEPPTEPPQ